MNIKTENIWNDFNSRLRGFVLSRVKNKDTADDILQDVYVKIHSNIENLKDSSKLQSWIYQIARNTITDYYRLNKILVNGIENIDFQDEEIVNDASRRIAPSIKRMVYSLPKIYRDALILTEYNGLSQKQLSEKIGISLSAVKSRVLRGREKLKEMLLECCHFELDKFNKIIDYHPNFSCCSAGTQQGDCS